ncbi:hypothetical protein KKF34_15000 [Myxococcota bacterium]|nr:hypothetical protein [Myxococcota bacterium]MBU1379516.1 hypothetical protein [Myxococcota bacterium]MBU1498184.1 hypothetical protein [Myxococcota bacterium]
MKFDDLFGTEDLLPDATTEKEPVETSVPVKTESDHVSGKLSSSEPPPTDALLENLPPPEVSDKEKRFFGMRITGQGGNGKYLIASVILILVSGFFVSMATIWVKMKKNRYSYELAGQVRLMKKLSRKKALYKLEYSYLKSRAEVKSAIEKDGWVEIHPKNIIHVKTALGKKGSKTK